MTWMCDPVWKVLQPQPYSVVALFARLNHISFQSTLKHWGWTSAMARVCGCIHMLIRNSRRCSNTLYMYDMDMWSSLKGLTASIILRSVIVCTPPLSPKNSVNSTILRVDVCYGKGGRVHPYICISTTAEGAQSPCICMKWMCDPFWKVFKPQSYSVLALFARLNHLSFQSTLQHWGWTSAMVRVEECIRMHMPIHNCRRYSNTLYMYVMDMWSSLIALTASII